MWQNNKRLELFKLNCFFQEKMRLRQQAWRHKNFNTFVDLDQYTSNSENTSMKIAPVFILDDDIEELEIAKEVWAELNSEHPLEVFTKAKELEERLSQGVNPFIIICDVSLKPTDGFALREKLMENGSSNYKSIPFVFWSTAASETQIRKAYDSGGHGFFLKGNTFDEIKKSIQLILAYWTASKTPTESRKEEGNVRHNSAM